ncbi:MAG: hypothetical protein Q9168_006845 [Polycauliona sp. 1 TL-2023]
MPRSKPPSFPKYLKQLKPSPSGRVCCPACRNYTYDEFELPMVEDHFRLHHLDSHMIPSDETESESELKRLLHLLNQRPETDAVRLDLAHACNKQHLQHWQEQHAAAYESTHQTEKYNKAQLPSVCLANFYLEASCDGRLRCRHRSCKDLPTFGATPENIKCHFTEVHCAHLIKNMSEIDRSKLQRDVQEEFSPDRTAWILDPLLREADERKSEWDGSSPQEKRKAEDLDRRRSKQMRSIHDYVRKRREWTVLRDLRTAFVSRNQHLLRLISESNAVKLKILGNYDQIDLLDTGILTFKDLLGGTSPKSLKEVVAFLHLSHSTAVVIRQHGNFSPSARDLALWRYGVPEGQRSLFDEIVHLLYPAVQNQYDYYVFEEPLHRGEAVDYFHGRAADILKDLDQHPDTNFSGLGAAFGDLIDPDADDESPPKANDSTRGPLDASTNVANQLSTDHQPSTSHGTGIPTTATTLEPLGFIECLKTTGIFIVVMHFLTYISQLGFLFWTLGNMVDDRSPDVPPTVTSNATTSSSSRFADILRSRVVSPLTLDPELSELRPLITVAMRTVEIRWLLSLRAFESFITTLVQYFPVPRDVFASLVEKTLACCSEAATAVDPEYIGSTHNGNFDDYDLVHVRSRQEYYLKAFLGAKHSHQPSDASSQSFEELSTDDPLTDDFDVNMTANDMTNLMDLDMDFDEFIKQSESDHLANASTNNISPRQTQDLAKDPNIALPSFNSTQTFDPPSADPIFQEPATPKNYLPMQLVPQTTMPTRQRRSCPVPSCNSVHIGSESKNNLRRHRREKHDKPPGCACPFDNCDLVCSRSSNLRQHWIKKHKGVPMPEELRPKREKGGGGMSRRMKTIPPVV